MKRPEVPCKVCAPGKRSAVCHAVCEDYKRFVEEYQEYKQFVEQEQLYSKLSTSFKIERCLSTKVGRYVPV